MESPVEQFIEKIRTDDALRQKVREAEKAAAQEIQGDLDAITQLAAKEGFDISGWPSRSINEVPPEAAAEFSECCLLTCCWVETSVAVMLDAEDKPGY